jgi:hypothetical protein
MSDFVLTSFTQEEYDKYVSDWDHDLKLDEGSEEVNVDDYKLALHPRKFDALAKVDVSKLPYEDKLRFFKFCLSCEGLNNASIISNLVILAQGRLIDEELYGSEDIFFADDLEYLDACTDLREDIKKFNTKIVTYFLGALKSMSSLIDNGAVHVPNLYYSSLSSYTLTTISSAMQKVSVDYDSIPYVINSQQIVDRICVRKNFVNEFVSDLLKEITEEK